MSRAEEILDLAVAPLISMLAKRSESCEWVPQVNLYFPNRVHVCALANGLPGDPIEGLETFGRRRTDISELNGIVVIAESIDDELMCSSSDVDMHQRQMDDS